MFYEFYQEDKSDKSPVGSFSFSTNKRNRKGQSLSFLGFYRQTSEGEVSKKENKLTKHKSWVS
jgi:hypothetical protein